VVIAWHGLPAYAARALKATPAAVVGTADVRSPDYIESLIGRKVTWMDAGQRVKWSDLQLDPPAVFFYTGWAYKAFNSLAVETKRNGGRTVCMMDNSRKFTFRQTLGKWYFRAAIQRNIDYFLVPGEAAQDLMKYFGVPQDKIHQGLYGADPEVFPPGLPLLERANDFVFVGQFIPRKGVHCLLEAAGILRKAGEQFNLVAIGQGPLRQNLIDAGIRVEPFSTPEAVAAWLRNSRFLVLPSTEDHWPLVVHEAARSGCGLILSEAVGNRLEFAGRQNSWTFSPGDGKALAESMVRALDLDERNLAACRAQSLALAQPFGPHRWNESFREILALCGVTVAEKVEHVR
jgi:glycosyltransferase involved in cell wall biosynthesis